MSADIVHIGPKGPPDYKRLTYRYEIEDVFDWEAFFNLIEVTYLDEGIIFSRKVIGTFETKGAAESELFNCEQRALIRWGALHPDEMRAIREKVNGTSAPDDPEPPEAA
jgi:hypothetical protein